MNGAKGTAEVNYNNQKRSNSQDLLGIRNQDSIERPPQTNVEQSLYFFHHFPNLHIFVNLMNQTFRFEFTDQTQDHIQFSPIMFVMK